jgi:hypothetical protein
VRRWWALAAVAAALAGCGDSGFVDAALLEAAVPRALLPEVPEAVTEVTCPEPIVRGEGIETGCAVSIGDEMITVTVVQADTTGTVELSAVPALLDTEDVAATIAERFTIDLQLETRVSCDPPRIRVLNGADPETLRCVATDPQGVDRAVEVLASADGDLDVRLER